MLIFMAGYPFAGKSFVVQMLVEKHCPDAIVIEPKRYRLENYDELNEDDKRDCNLAAWEISLEELEEKIKNESPKKVIIYDTACASFYKMEPYYQMALECGHRVIYAFVDAPLELCEKRAGKLWLPNDVIEKYHVNFSESVEKLAKIANTAVIIKNSSDEPPEVSKITDLLGKT